MPKKPAEPKEPTVAVKKALFALSGNRCAFPACDKPMADPDGTVRGKVCHIKGSAPNSPRHDPGQPAHERHGFYNLLVMCADHHDEIDGKHAHQYPVELLTQWKTRAETEVGGQELDPAAINVGDGSVAVISQNQSGGIIAGALNFFGFGAGDPAEPTDDALQLLFRLTRCPTDQGMRGMAGVHHGMNGFTFMFPLGEHPNFEPEDEARMFAAFENLDSTGLARITGEHYGQPVGLKVTARGWEVSRTLPDLEDRLWWKTK